MTGIAVVGGLLLGVAFMQGGRAQIFQDSPSRAFIAKVEMYLYLVAGTCCVVHVHMLQLIGLLIAIVGPILAFIAVVASGNKPDAYSINAGWVQLLALVLSVIQLARIHLEVP